ncbi:SDR family NAD(P)-dependent oxidoreductase [Pseudoalteromonas sp. FUC4]|uniref:SDR family NAD(P)-dependent oxidoreductase n=1 Tax=Pseudoalteromonas sp. FUC4 TaxID=2511201 RepID=UPI00165D7153|nr:SDR family NAD(P)-dependent oxidoreductase [Pseudoalteromonas sp. FUC4]
MNEIIITGCTSGVGLAFHEIVNSGELLDNYNVLYLGRDLSRLTKSDNQKYLELDLSQSGYINWDLIYGYPFPKLITLISNASIIDPLGKITPDNFDTLKQSLNVNILSPIEIFSSLARWAEANSVLIKIINITSGAANSPIAGWGAYCMTKAGIKMFLDVMSKESEHIEVIHFDPGVIDTGMQAKIRQATADEMPLVDNFKDFKVNGQLKSPTDVALKLIDMCKL